MCNWSFLCEGLTDTSSVREEKNNVAKFAGVYRSVRLRVKPFDLKPEKQASGILARGLRAVLGPYRQPFVRIQPTDPIAFTCHPSRLSNTVSRRYPKRTRLAANSRNRMRNASCGSRRLRYCKEARAIGNSLETRRSLT